MVTLETLSTACLHTVLVMTSKQFHASACHSICHKCCGRLIHASVYWSCQLLQLTGDIYTLCTLTFQHLLQNHGIQITAGLIHTVAILPLLARTANHKVT